MRKISLLLVFTLLFALTLPALTACHGAISYAGFSIPEDFSPDKSYEITFWAKNDNNETQQKIYRDTIERFQEYYPNIEVNLVLYSDYRSIYEAAITNIQTGTTPNVCISYPDHVATYMSGENIVVPLDNLIADEKYGLGGTEIRFDAPTRAEMYDKFIEEGKIGTEQYTIPFMRSTEACYVNQAMVEKLGYTLPEVLTWDFVFEVSRAAMEKNADGTYKLNGQKTLLPLIYKSTDNMMIQMLAQLGADYSTDSGEVLIFNEDTEGILYDVAEQVGYKAFTTFAIDGYPGNYFNQGQCIFAIDSTAGATWIGTDAPQQAIDKELITEVETVVMEIPQYNPIEPKMISQGPSVCLFNKEDAGEVMASWIFLQFLLTNEVQIPYSQTEGYVPVTKKATESAEYQDYLSRRGEDNNLYYSVKIDAARLTLDNIENTFITPVFNGSANVRAAAGDLIEEVTKAIRRKKKVDEKFLNSLYTEMRRKHKLDEISVNMGGSVDLGPMPKGSVALIVGLISAWVLIGGYVGYKALSGKRRK